VYQNYRLEVEYRFAGKPGNCGVLVHASTRDKTLVNDFEFLYRPPQVWSRH